MKKTYIFIAVVLLISNACKRELQKDNQFTEANQKAPGVEALTSSAVDYWLTKGDQSVLLQQQPACPLVPPITGTQISMWTPRRFFRPSMALVIRLLPAALM